MSQHGASHNLAGTHPTIFIWNFNAFTNLAPFWVNQQLFYDMDK